MCYTVQRGLFVQHTPLSEMVLVAVFVREDELATLAVEIRGVFPHYMLLHTAHGIQFEFEARAIFDRVKLPEWTSK